MSNELKAGQEAQVVSLLCEGSKKFENFQAAVALNFCYYNFVKTHGVIRMTPAQAAGVESSAWTVTELVERCGE